jgi:diguanylate cyclase (GGDEF)-like protein/PAS domain S-box-containing protein
MQLRQLITERERHWRGRLPEAAAAAWWKVIPEALHSEALALSVLLATNTRDGVAVLDSNGQLLFWNAAAVTITGWSITEAAGRSLDQVAESAGSLTAIRDGKWVEIRHNVIEANGQRFTVILFTDSTPQVRLRDARDQLRALGLIDLATNLAGRELAMVHLEQAIALAKRDKRSVGALSVKLDRFRDLRSGDGDVAAETIRQFAKRMAAFVRASDVPARLSEDSFLVVLTALMTSNDAAVVAVRLLLALAEPFDVVGKARTLHCSIGVAESPRDAEEATGLLGAALGAADRAQLLGGGRFCVASEQ